MGSAQGAFFCVDNQTGKAVYGVRIERVRLCGFRNYESLTISPGGSLNLISGENGQGKTNLIESIFLCAVGRSHRTKRDKDLINREARGAYIGVDISNATGAHRIEIRLFVNERRRICVDGALCERSGELMGVLNAVLFSPESMSLIKGGPAERRRFLDMGISQLHPSYYYALQQYNAALKQRNALIKDLSAPLDLIRSWDSQLAKYGGEVVKRREDFFKIFPVYADGIYTDISGGAERLEISYERNEGALYIGESLKRNLDEDRRRGYTGTGPHRDDISILINGSDIRYFGSQGQQRTAALAMKLSEIELVYAVKGEYPVLLLDDVLSELDEKRKRKLIDSVEKCQCFLTSASELDAKVVKLMRAKAFTCANGQIKEDST